MTLSLPSVLHVLAPARFGGLERVVESLVAGQIQAGIDARILTIVEPGEADHPFVRSVRHSGAPVEVLIVPPRRYLAERRGVVEHCRRLRPMVVHLHGARPDVLDGPVIRRAGFPVVSTVHGFTGGDHKNRLYEALQRRALRRVDAVVAVSRPLWHQLAQHGVPGKRLHLVPNAAPPDTERLPRAAARAELGLDATGPMVGWVGRLTSEKGCDVFIDAVTRLNGSDVGVSIIGTGKERPALERAVFSTGLAGRVVWHGEVTAAGRVLKAFEVLVISSRSEGTPMVLFEAIQAGVPIVATTVGGIPDVVSHDEAFLVSSERPAELAHAIQRVLADPSEAARRATRARSRIATEFSLRHWVEGYSAVYAAAIRRERGDIGARACGAYSRRPAEPT